MRPKHRAPRPAWGENPQRPARYGAAGLKPRAVRASGGRSRSPGREDPDLHSARRGFSDDARTLSMEFAGYLRTAPAHAGKPHPGSVDQRLQPSRPRSTRYRAPSRSPSLVRSSTTRIRTGSRCKCVSTSCAIRRCPSRTRTFRSPFPTIFPSRYSISEQSAPSPRAPCGPC